MIEKIVLYISHATSVHLCSLSAQICVMSVRTSVTQRNQQSIGYLTLQRGVTCGAHMGENTSCRGVLGPARHVQALIHSVIYRQQREQLQSGCFEHVREGAVFLMVWKRVPTNYFFISFSPLEIRVFFLHLCRSPLFTF